MHLVSAFDNYLGLVALDTVKRRTSMVAEFELKGIYKPVTSLCRFAAIHWKPHLLQLLSDPLFMHFNKLPPLHRIRPKHSILLQTQHRLPAVLTQSQVLVRRGIFSRERECGRGTMTVVAFTAGGVECHAVSADPAEVLHTDDDELVVVVKVVDEFIRLLQTGGNLDRKQDQRYYHLSRAYD